MGVHDETGSSRPPDNEENPGEPNKPVAAVSEEAVPDVDPNGTRDSRDEEEDDDEEDDESSNYEYIDDQLTYSDDSASLSDAYFHPQSDDDLARPPRYRTPSPGGEHEPLTAAIHQYPLASMYGAVSTRDDRATSPLWVSGSIQEDAEAMIPMGLDTALMTEDVTSGIVSKKERRKQRRLRAYQQHLRRKQREQAAREKAVTEVRGQPQEVTSWQDPFFAILFLVQLTVVILLACRFGFGVIRFQEDSSTHWAPIKGGRGHFHWQSRNTAEVKLKHNSSLGEMVYTDDFSSANGSSHNHASSASASSATTGAEAFTIDYQTVIALVGISGFYACMITYFTFGIMLILARSLIQIMLIFSVLLSLAWGMIGLSLDPYGVISVMGFGALLLTLGYTMYNWNRIPFAATNLYTALCALRCTADITILGMTSILACFGWCLIWTMAFIGIVNSFNSADCEAEDLCNPHLRNWHIPLYLLLLFSFHWTNMVIKNVVRVTMANVIGIWWFRPHEISPFCSSAVALPLLRSLTKSLGSICLGSLILQPAQVFAVVGKCFCCIFGNADSSCMNPQRRRIVPEGNGISKSAVDEPAADSVGLCQPLCRLTERLGFLLRACNRWSYTYIGMYGYSFLEAGERAFQLFATREWLDVVKDNLIQNVLLMASIVIGGTTGVFAVVVEEMDGYEFSSFHKPIAFAFVIGSILGYTLSNILLLGVVGSAVNTILVCFAAGPFEFDKNHPRLSGEMREVWSQQVWEPPV